MLICSLIIIGRIWIQLFWRLSSSDSDDRATIADFMKGKTGGVELLVREGSLGPEAGISCPKKPRTTVWKRRASDDVR